MCEIIYAVSDVHRWAIRTSQAKSSHEYSGALAVTQETNECQVDQAIQQGFLFGDRAPLASLVSSLNEFRLTEGQKMTASNSGMWSFYRLGSKIIP